MRLSLLTLLGLFLVLTMGMTPFNASASASCVQVYNPCNPPEAPTAHPYRWVHAHHKTRTHIVPIRRIPIPTPMCAILVEDRTPQGIYSGVANHAQIRVVGGRNDGWPSKRFTLERGANLLPIPCDRARDAPKIQVWLFGNETTCRYISNVGGDVVGIINSADPIWMSRS